MGIIMLLVIGPALGNYATSVVYRLPKGETPFEKHPYCGDCGTMLQPKDLFPLWSFLFSKGKCNYCGVKIRPMYFCIELISLVICLTNFLFFGITEAFILLNNIAILWLIAAAIEWHEGVVYKQMLGYTAAIVAIMRVLVDDSIYPMIQSGFIGLFASLILWKLLHRRNEQLPHYVYASALLGLAVPLVWLPKALLAYAIMYGLLRLIWKNPHLHLLASGATWWAITLYYYY